MDTYKRIEPKAAQLRDQAAAAQSRFGAGNVYLAYREDAFIQSKTRNAFTCRRVPIDVVLLCGANRLRRGMIYRAGDSSRLLRVQKRKFWTEFSADPARPSAAVRRRELAGRSITDHRALDGPWPAQPWVPLEIAHLGRPQAVPVGNQDHGGIAMTVAAAFPGRHHQRLDLGRRQILARSGNCGIYDGWRRVAACL
jgi:hypothetical protein